jgi:hypothetical protein
MLIGFQVIKIAMLCALNFNVLSDSLTGISSKYKEPKVCLNLKVIQSHSVNYGSEIKNFRSSFFP